MDKVQALEEAVSEAIQPGQRIMIGGFGRGGVPFSILEFLADNPETFRDFTFIKNDGNEVNLGIGMLIRQGQVKRLISTHIGLNPEAIEKMNSGEMECELIPQGIFAERIRAGGAGIAAILTDIGIDTVVAKGKPTMELDGERYLVERALRGDVAIICADKADRLGNCWWRGSHRNMCVVMGTACDHTIVEAKEIVEVGALEPENIHLPHVWVDAVVKASPRRHIEAAEAAKNAEEASA